MQQTRRRFIQTTGIGLGALTALSPTLGADPAADVPGGGPRLLFDRADLTRIRATVTRPEFAALWRSKTEADLAADEHFLRDQLNPADLLTDLGRAGEILTRSAFVHAVAPDPRQLALARLAFSRIMAYPRWDWFFEADGTTVGIMRCPLICISTILACDWLGDELGAGAREDLVRRISLEHGPACRRAVFGMTHHDQVVGWTMGLPAPGQKIVDVSRWPVILDHTNLRIIATAGLAAVACFLKDRHPQAGQWCEESRASLRLFAARMPVDQSFTEGIGYWEFTFTSYIVALELLRRTYGVDERGILDFPAMARYALALAAPTAGRPIDCVNIGDGSRAATATPLTWIGREFRDGTAQFLVARLGAAPAGTKGQWWAAAWFDVGGAIWYDAGVPARIAADLPLDRRAAPGLVLSRSGWEPADSVLCLRSGGPGNHEHADRNSVIFMAHGERLLNDPLAASYYRDDPKWLLRLTAAHTAVLVNGQGHVYIDGSEGTNASTATASLVDYEVGLGWMRTTSDATDAYRRAGLPVRRVVRTVLFFKPEVLVLFDEVALDQPGSVQVRFQAFNDDGQGTVEPGALGFTIRRPQASLQVRLAAGGAITVARGQLDLPAGAGIYPYAEVASAPAREHRILTICTAAPRGAEHGVIAVTGDTGTWRVSGTHRAQRLALRILESPDGRPPQMEF